VTGSSDAQELSITPVRIENSELTIVSFFIVKWIVSKKGFVATYVGRFTKIAKCSLGGGK
jgi:hypothetical protein